MIQFNLLPDVKKQYIKAKRTKRLIISFSTLAAGAALAVVIVMFLAVQVGQKGHIGRLGDDIDAGLKRIENVEDLDKILTIQAQLESLNTLHETKPESSRLFNYLYQITPVTVKIRKVEVDFVNSQMKINGSADSLASINQYADTLKFAKMTIATGQEGTEGKPFSSVATKLNRDDVVASYELTFEFDPILFDNTQDVTIFIPTQVTTRSIVGKPSLQAAEGNNSLFEDAGEEEVEQ